MKIVDQKTFLSLPPETLFSKYSPCYFEQVCIKGETRGDDFLVQQISDAVNSTAYEDFTETLTRALTTGESIPLNFESQGRDGLFEEDQLFAVWEPVDVAELIVRLSRCIPSLNP